VNPLDDTTRCPVAAACASCGTGADLAVCTAQTPVGVYCLTLCDRCVDEGRLPRPGSLAKAYEAVGGHAVHVGLDVDQMAALLDEERG
jgi:hypothetical protein